MYNIQLFTSLLILFSLETSNVFFCYRIWQIQVSRLSINKKPIPQNNTEDSATRPRTKQQASPGGWPTLVFLCFGLGFVVIHPEHLHLLLQIFLTDIVRLEAVTHKLVLIWTARGKVFLLGALVWRLWQVWNSIKLIYSLKTM